MEELSACIYAGFPHLGSTDDPHGVQHTPKAECFFLRKASLTFIQFSKRFTMLLRNQGIGISVLSKKVVPHRLYRNRVGFSLKSTLREQTRLCPKWVPYNHDSSENLSQKHSHTAWVTAPQCYTVPRRWSLLKHDLIHLLAPSYAPALPGNPRPKPMSNNDHLEPGSRVTCTEVNLSIRCKVNC